MKLIILALVLSGCAAEVQPCQIWHMDHGVKVCEADPYTAPETSDACEAKAQSESPCPDLKAAKCDGFWDAYDLCMRGAK